MAEEGYPHKFQIGDAVLATVGEPGVAIPGVIEAEEDGKFQVSLSQPWVDESSQEVQDVWLTPDKLDPAGSEETGGVDLLPG